MGVIIPWETTLPRVHSICSCFSMGTFLRQVEWGAEGLLLMVHVPSWLPMVSKQARKGSHLGKYVLGHGCGRIGHLSWAGFGGLRAGLSCLPLGWEDELGTTRRGRSLWH